MSKPLFFTGRKEIAREDVLVRLCEERGKMSRFTVKIDLLPYSLPEDAKVVVEAYHNAYLERFPIGTVSSLNGEFTQTLERLEPGDRPLFRLKVISGDSGVTGKLLAAIDEIRPETEDDTGAAGSLLPLVPKTREEMGDEFWRVHFVSADEPYPELWINREVQGLLASLQNHDPKVTSLIMPEVFRQVLRGLVEREGISWTDEGRLGQWLLLAKQLHPEEFDEWDEDDPEPSRQQRREWVDAVVRRFAALHQFFERYHQDFNAQENHDE